MRYGITVGKLTRANMAALDQVWHDGDMGEGIHMTTTKDTASFTADYEFTALNLAEAFERALEPLPKTGFPYGTLLATSYKVRRVATRAARRRNSRDERAAPDAG